jgi:hypothetical protein
VGRDGKTHFWPIQREISRMHVLFSHRCNTGMRWDCSKLLTYAKESMGC